MRGWVGESPGNSTAQGHLKGVCVCGGVLWTGLSPLDGAAVAGGRDRGAEEVSSAEGG